MTAPEEEELKQESEARPCVHHHEQRGVLGLVQTVKDRVVADVVVVAFEGGRLNPPRHILDCGAVDLKAGIGRNNRLQATISTAKAKKPQK